MEEAYRRIQEEVNTENIFDLLSKYGIEDAKPFIKNLSDKRNYMLLSYEILVNEKKALNEKLHAMNMEKKAERKTQGFASFGECDTKKWNVIIDGYEINFRDMIRKTVWEFFHYSRITIDTFGSIINAALLKCEQSIRNDDIRRKLKSRENQYLDMSALIERISLDDTYRYICAFDNYMKHINEVPVRVKLNSPPLFDFSDLEVEGIYVEGFSYNEKDYNEGEAEEIMTTVRDYTVEIIKEFLSVLFFEQYKNMNRSDEDKEK